jgi:hypothetical protein
MVVPPEASPLFCCHLGKVAICSMQQLCRYYKGMECIFERKSLRKVSFGDPQYGHEDKI